MGCDLKMAEESLLVGQSCTTLHSCFKRSAVTVLRLCCLGAQEELLLSKQLEMTKTSIEVEDVPEWSDIKGRWTLAASLFLLYFVCVPPKPQVCCNLERSVRHAEIYKSPAFQYSQCASSSSGNSL